MPARPSDAAVGAWEVPRTVYPLIAIEGPDAAGKTTIRKRTFQRLREHGLEPLSMTSHSWLSARNAEVMTNARFNERLYPPHEITAAHVRDKELLARTLVDLHRPWRPILVDRYLASDIVYHQVLWQIPPEVTYEALTRSGAAIPDLTILVRTPLEVAQERLRRRDPKSLRYWDTPELQQRIVRQYDELYSAERYAGLGPAVAVDNSGSLERTFEAIEELVVAPIVGSRS